MAVLEYVLLRHKPQFTWPGLIIVLLGVPAYYLWRHLGAREFAVRAAAAAD